MKATEQYSVLISGDRWFQRVKLKHKFTQLVRQSYPSLVFPNYMMSYSLVHWYQLYFLNGKLLANHMPRMH